MARAGRHRSSALSLAGVHVDALVDHAGATASAGSAPSTEMARARIIDPSAPPVVVHEPTRYERHVKPLLDRIAALVLLMLASPVLLAIALVVRLHLGPGIVYRQMRIGRGGRAFAMYKFRTMHPDKRRDRGGQTRSDRRSGMDRRDGVDRRTAVIDLVELEQADRRRGGERRVAERRKEPAGRRRDHKSPHDPRHTRLGRFLRESSLDELLQLVNVVRGEMSLVGPRPELPEVVDRYEPWQHIRHAVKPGLTGLWQVTDRGTGDPMHLHVLRDVAYIERLSLLTDLKILIRTVPVALGIGGQNRGF